MVNLQRSYDPEPLIKQEFLKPRDFGPGKCGTCFLWLGEENPNYGECLVKPDEDGKGVRRNSEYGCKSWIEFGSGFPPMDF